MKSTVLMLLLAIASITSYGQHKLYQPKGLRKWTEEEMIARARKHITNTESVVFKDSLGKVITKEVLGKTDWKEWTADQYVDAEGNIQEVIVRKATQGDRVLMAKIQEAWEEGEPLKLVDVDCASKKTMLEDVYQKDQGNRQNNATIDSEIDRRNQQTVVSLIEKCGFPTREQVGNTGMYAVFLVIQHASPQLRKKYFPLIKESADKGDLNRSAVALMEDRMLMEKGEKQKYGSQITKKNNTDSWELYPIEDPLNVNKRRAEVGLGPIEEYLLKHFQIIYSPKEGN